MILLDYIVVGIISFSTFVFILLLGNVIGYLIGHATRKSIQYKNYNAKSKYFNVQMPNSAFLLFTLLLVVLGFTLILIFFGGYKEYYSYAYSGLGLIVLSILLYVMFTLLSHFNKSLTIYHDNYKQVNIQLKSADKAKTSVQKTKEYRKNIFTLITGFEKQINEVEDSRKFNLQDSLTIIDDFVVKQEEKINTFSSEIIDSFDQGLALYIEKGVATKLTESNVSLEFENEYGDVRKDIYEGYKTIFNNTLYTLIETQKYNTADRIQRGLQILKDNNYLPSAELIGLILEKIDTIKGSNQSLIEYLLTNEIITLDELTTYAIDKNATWVFKLDLYKTQTELITISKRLIKEDAHTLALQFISTYFVSLKNVLAFTTKIVDVNQTHMLFTNYKKVMQFDTAFFTEHKEYENKVIALKNFYKNKKPSSKLQNDLYSVNDVKNAYSNTDTINKLYRYTQTKYDELYTKSIKAVLLYVSVYDEGGLFDVNKVSSTLNDYYERLLFRELSLLSILLYTLFIHKNTDDELYHDVMNDIKNTQELSNYVPDRFLKSDPIKHKIIFKDIIKYFEKNYSNDLANIVLKIEQNRCTLDILSRGE